jgi:hypothetical protein
VDRALGLDFHLGVACFGAIGVARDGVVSWGFENMGLFHYDLGATVEIEPDLTDLQTSGWNGAELLFECVVGNTGFGCCLGWLFFLLDSQHSLVMSIAYLLVQAIDVEVATLMECSHDVLEPDARYCHCVAYRHLVTPMSAFWP